MHAPANGGRGQGATRSPDAGFDLQPQRRSVRRPGSLTKRDNARDTTQVPADLNFSGLHGPFHASGTLGGRRGRRDLEGPRIKGRDVSLLGADDDCAVAVVLCVATPLVPTRSWYLFYR